MTVSLPTKKYFTVGQANAMLPLVRSIVRDITELAQQMQARHKRLLLVQEVGPTRQDEIDELSAAQDADHTRLQELVDELHALGVELKDFFSGLVDFRCLMNGREVYLCWKLGEESVSHWHELDAGFAGRQKLPRGMCVEPNGR